MCQCDLWCAGGSITVSQEIPREFGKQGFEIASELTKRGAQVTLISGPVNIPFPVCKNIIQIKTAQEMLDSVTQQLQETAL